MEARNCLEIIQFNRWDSVLWNCIATNMHLNSDCNHFKYVYVCFPICIFPLWKLLIFVYMWTEYYEPCHAMWLYNCLFPHEYWYFVQQLIFQLKTSDLYFIIRFEPFQFQNIIQLAHFTESFSICINIYVHLMLLSDPFVAYVYLCITFGVSVSYSQKQKCQRI